MVGSGPNGKEFVGSWHEDQFVNLERRRDHEVNHPPNVHTTHTCKSHSRTRSHVSHGEETSNLSWRLTTCVGSYVIKERRVPFSFGTDSGEDGSYRSRSRTPPSESFFAPSQLYKEKRYHRKRDKSPTHRSLGNDAMSRALRQISKSPFTRRIDRAKLPHRFT